jgi:hypothetical protein
MNFFTALADWGKFAYRRILLFSEKIKNAVNFIVLSVVYFLGVGLTSIFAKIAGKHFLGLKKADKSASYWKKRDLNSEKEGDFLNQF